MINEVRATVLSVLNKNNYGYITPADFNLYAEQAQISIFESLFDSYNDKINKENARVSGSGYANLSKLVEEEIEDFSTNVPLVVIADNTFTMPSDAYSTTQMLYFDGASYVEMDKANRREIIMLSNSLDVAPSSMFPVYTVEGNVLTAYPSTINTTGDVICDYIRYPKAPKWTYFSVGVSQEPIFNESAVDYQDFELSRDFAPQLIYRILQLSGMSVRELGVYEMAQKEQQEEEK